jgi:hypothetical protein
MEVALVAVLVASALLGTAKLIDELINGGKDTDSAGDLLAPVRSSGSRTTSPSRCSTGSWMPAEPRPARIASTRTPTSPSRST